ncbi:MAG: alpha/beta hydrolase-fold protein [Bacteroidota bacterium]
MNKLLGIFLLAILPLRMIIAQPIEIGSVHQFQSNILQEERRYSVSVPASYEHDPFYQEKAYPVLLVLDGERLFQQTATVVKALSQRSVEKIPEMIVVAIHNTDRNRDMLPTSRGEINPGEASFRSFLEDELLPEIAKKYRTLNCHILVGHSFAGLFTANTFLKESKFHAFLAIDPSLHWGGASIVSKAQNNTRSFNGSIYISQANNPFNPGVNVGAKNQAIQSFHEILSGSSFSAVHHKLDFFEKEDHFSVPLISMYEGLSFLFEGYQYPLDQLAEASEQELQAHYEDFTKRIGGNVLIPGKLFQQVASFLLQQGNVDQAKMLFSFTSRHFPTSFQPLEGLGQAYASLELSEKADSIFHKVLELNPESNVASRYFKERE